MKKILSTILLTLAMLMPTALWAQSLAGDSAIVAEAYVVLSTDSTGSTLTFYYDDQKENREGTYGKVFAVTLVLVLIMITSAQKELVIVIVLGTNTPVYLTQFLLKTAGSITE